VTHRRFRERASRCDRAAVAGVAANDITAPFPSAARSAAASIARVPQSCPGSALRALRRRSAAQVAGEPACRPGSVHPRMRAGGHPSRAAVADSLVRPTREHRTGRPQTLAQEAENSGTLPSWPCSGWGLPSRPGHPGRWWSLTPPFHPYPPGRPGAGPWEAVCFLWHCPAGHPGSVLPTTLPCGARTFLTAHRAARPPGRLARHRKGILPRPAGCHKRTGQRPSASTKTGSPAPPGRAREADDTGTSEHTSEHHRHFRGGDAGFPSPPEGRVSMPRSW